MLYLFLACQPPSDSATPKTVDEARAEIKVDPPEISFGQVLENDTVAHMETVTVSNIGDSALELYGLALENTNAPFSLSALDSVLVAPGQSTFFTVTFEPRTAEASETNVIIQSNDLNDEFSIVHILGIGVAPVIVLAPEVYDFGMENMGCTMSIPLAIRNIGNADLVVDALSYVTVSNDLAIDILENDPLPWTLIPNSEITINVLYSPSDAGVDEGYLQVSSNDPLKPLAQASHRAEGVAEQRTDRYVQPIQNKVDIIFALDASGSMADNLINAQENFDAFVQALADIDADYQMTIVTDDDGCINNSPPYIDNTMTLADQSLWLDATLNSYTPGLYEEQGFTLLEAATGPQNLGSGGCNEGLLRADAQLILVGVTDTAEQSVNPYSYYVSLFQSLKPDPAEMVMHAIAGDYPNGCSTATAGLGWYEATVATEGLFLSICAADWSSQLQTLAESTTVERFALSAWPVPETIVVSINGVPVTLWSYAPDDNKVVFEAGMAPEGGSTIEISYTVEEGC